jgi:hypothetical protein
MALYNSRWHNAPQRATEKILQHPIRFAMGLLLLA